MTLGSMLCRCISRSSCRACSGCEPFSQALDVMHPRALLARRHQRRKSTCAFERWSTPTGSCLRKDAPNGTQSMASTDPRRRKQVTKHTTPKAPVIRMRPGSVSLPGRKMVTERATPIAPVLCSQVYCAKLDTSWAAPNDEIGGNGGSCLVQNEDGANKLLSFARRILLLGHLCDPFLRAASRLKHCSSQATEESLADD